MMSFTRYLRFSLSAKQRWSKEVAASSILSPAIGIRRIVTTAEKIAVSEEGKRLQVVWNGQGGVPPSSYHSVWLRSNCQCLKCVSECNQLLHQWDELDYNTTISGATVTGVGDVKIKWSCGHEGHLNLDWLKRHCYSPHTLEKARRESLPILSKQAVLPKMDARELEDDKGLLRWLKNVSEHGMCLLTGVPCNDEGALQITRKVSPHVQVTFYGGLTTVKVDENPINISNSATSLMPHMDMPQYQSPIGVVLLQCLRLSTIQLHSNMCGYVVCLPSM
jgi:hypothetical protein